jgi:hypothetical protein
MNILSIDVGMKNLAICLFHITDELNYKIKCWDVLDLCNEKKYTCGEKTKNGKICNKNAKFTKNNKYYCKIHAKDKKYKIPPQELKMKKIKKLKIASLKKLADKYSIKYEKEKKVEIQELFEIKLEKDYFDNILSLKTKDFNLVQYGRNLKKIFNETFKDINIDGVIVENQIGPLAMRMKTLQGMIMQHFIEKDIPLVEEVSASNKLKEFLGTKKTTYAERKKHSINITKNILNENNFLAKWVEPFNNHKKKDDLADSFLQGRWYLKNTILKDKIK